MSHDKPPDEPPGETIDLSSSPVPPAGARPPLDLAKASPGQTPFLELAPYSQAWAKILWPITRSIFALIAAVMLLPFLLIVLSDAKTDEVLDWAKTILPPVVGFGGAVVGYYFGTRTGQAGGDSDD